MTNLDKIKKLLSNGGALTAFEIAKQTAMHIDDVCSVVVCNSDIDGGIIFKYHSPVGRDVPRFSLIRETKQ